MICRTLLLLAIILAGGCHASDDQLAEEAPLGLAYRNSLAAELEMDVCERGQEPSPQVMQQKERFVRLKRSARDKDAAIIRKADEDWQKHLGLIEIGCSSVGDELLRVRRDNYNSFRENLDRLEEEINRL